jgi:hypothetical protein
MVRPLERSRVIHATALGNRGRPILPRGGWVWPIDP